MCLLKCLKLGQLHVMMVWLEKPRRSGVADALQSANSNTRSSGFKYISWREIYPTKISWNLENQNSTRNPQVK